MVVDVTHDAKVYMPLAELVDIEKEKARLQKDLGKKQGELKGLEGKLSNPGFLAKAPEARGGGGKGPGGEAPRPHRQIGGTTGGYGVRPKREGRECGVPLSLPSG